MGQFIKKWGGYGTGDGKFGSIYALAIDTCGYIYATDSSFTPARVQKFTLDGTFVTKWGEYGTGDDQFRGAAGIAISSSGYIYVSDLYGNRIQKFTPDGVFITKWGVSGNGEGQLDGPSEIDFDKNGYLYVEEVNNCRVQKFTTDGDFIAAFGSYGTADGQFNYPEGGILVGDQDYVYVTDFDNARVQKFRPVAPSLPTGLSVKRTQETIIKLEWSPSTSIDVSKYNIYWNSGTGAIDYTSPIATVLHPTTSWVSQPLEISKIYKFGVRVKDIYNIEEGNTNFISVIPIDSFTQPKAVIKIPQLGKKITGNRITVMAKLIVGEPSDVKQILFQYKSVGSLVWENIEPVGISHPNPDTNHPYFVHWDVSTLNSGYYELCAVAEDKNNNKDKNPVTITIIIDHTEFDIKEEKNGGEYKKIENIDNRIENTIIIGDNTINNCFQLIIPNDSLDTIKKTITIILNPGNIPEKKQGNLLEVGKYCEIKIAQQTKLLNNKEATITIPYKDDNDDGYVDGLNIPERYLSLFYYNTDIQKWEKEKTEIDKENNLCIVEVSHLSLYGVFGVPADNLGNVRAYPNPFKPSKGHTWMKFDNLTVNSSIKIYTIAGDLVWGMDDIDTGEVLWYGNNSSGEKLASGMYIYIVTNNKGEKSIGKLAILR